MNKLGKIVAFEEFGGFENNGKDLGKFEFIEMNGGTLSRNICYKRRIV